jgi:hypothetical protein
MSLKHPSQLVVRFNLINSVIRSPHVGKATPEYDTCQSEEKFEKSNFRLVRMPLLRVEGFRSSSLLAQRFRHEATITTFVIWQCLLRVLGYLLHSELSHSHDRHDGRERLGKQNWHANIRHWHLHHLSRAAHDGNRHCGRAR